MEKWREILIRFGVSVEIEAEGLRVDNSLYTFDKFEVSPNSDDGRILLLTITGKSL